MSKQRFLHIGLGPFLGIDFEFPPYELNEQYNAAHVNTLAASEIQFRERLEREGLDAQKIWADIQELNKGSMFNGQTFPGVSHEDADNIAQRTLGNIEPMPGESPDEFDARSQKAELAFRKKYPQWRG